MDQNTERLSKSSIPVLTGSGGDFQYTTSMYQNQHYGYTRSRHLCQNQGHGTLGGIKRGVIRGSEVPSRAPGSKKKNTIYFIISNQKFIY